MRCLLIVLVVQGVVSLQLGVVHLRQPAPSRALVVLSEVLLANDASAIRDCESSHKMGVRAQNPVVSEEECIVNAENAAEAEACKDPPLKRVVKMPNREIDGYAESGAKRPGAPNPNCRRGTHGLDECLAESENAQEIADCYADYGATPPK